MGGWLVGVDDALLHLLEASGDGMAHPHRQGQAIRRTGVFMLMVGGRSPQGCS